MISHKLPLCACLHTNAETQSHVLFWRSLFTFSRQFLESLFSAFLLHHYPLFTSPFPFAPLLSPYLLHFELFTSLSSLVPTLSIHWYHHHHHHHHPTPCCEFCRPRLFIFFLLLNFNSILNPNTGGGQGVACVELHHLRVAHKQRAYVTTY